MNEDGWREREHQGRVEGNLCPRHNDDGATGEQAMRVPTQIAAELEANARRLREKAQAVEERWRTAHGLDDTLRTKHQRKTKPERRVRR
jgi:hypothetical protein